jgi:hypothetical protein
MYVRVNSILAKILSDNNYDFLKQNLNLPKKLQELIDSGFRMEQDCVLLKDFLYFGPGELKSDFEKCSYEDFLNNIHVDVYISNATNEFEYLKIGLEVGKQLFQKLQGSFANNFRLTISYNETTYNGQEIEVYGGCVIKFYTIRQSCEDKFRVDDLDAFQTEGVMVLE